MVVILSNKVFNHSCQNFSFQQKCDRSRKKNVGLDFTSKSGDYHNSWGLNKKEERGKGVQIVKKTLSRFSSKFRKETKLLMPNKYVQMSETHTISLIDTNEQIKLTIEGNIFVPNFSSCQSRNKWSKNNSINAPIFLTFSSRVSDWSVLRFPAIDWSLGNVLFQISLLI